jgi:hypothetical protein
MKSTGIYASNFGHRISIEEVNCYISIPFDIVCERDRYYEYSLTVVNNKTKVTLEVKDQLSHEDIHDERDKLIWKYLIELAK